VNLCATTTPVVGRNVFFQIRRTYFYFENALGYILVAL
jgi:hypothetical protein